jgi:hypothetical protein
MPPDPRALPQKSDWGPGPWHDEPDRVDFEHGGLPCLLLRGSLGSWCGYAAVPPGHPWHGKSYHDCLAPAGDPAHVSNENDWHDCEQRPDCLIEAHGGLTYSDACQGPICHEGKPGAPHPPMWWFGFDCAHYMDLTPAMIPLRKRMGHSLREDSESYRDLAYVRAQTERLAQQLAAVQP